MRCIVQSSNKKILVLIHRFGCMLMLCGFSSCTPLYQTQTSFLPFKKALQSKSPLWRATGLGNPIHALISGSVFLGLLLNFPARPFTFFLSCCVSQRCCIVSIYQRDLTDPLPICPQSSPLQ